MNSSKAFTSNNNKRILWDFLLNNSLFNDIPSDKEGYVKELFESKILNVEKNVRPNDTVINLNKKFISAYVKELKKIKAPPRRVTFENSRQSIQKKSLLEDRRLINERKTENPSLFQDRLSDRGVVTAEKHKEMRQRDFNNKLETRQKDFANMFAKNTPADIDFSDIQDDEEGYIDNMDERISEIMSSRENDLKELFDGKLEDAKQLIDTTTPIENIESTPFNNKMKLNIGNDTEIDDVQYISSKKNREQTIENEFPTNEPQKELYELLNNILDNQKVILERLDQIKMTGNKLPSRQEQT